MKETIKIAIVGCSQHMYDFLFDRMKFLPVELMAICDIDRQRMDQFARRYYVPSKYLDYKEMLACEQLEAVICSSSAQVHYEVAKACMLANVHVFVGKAPCETIEQMQELLEIQRKTGYYTMATFNRRFTTAYVMAKEILGRPEFGTPYLYQAKYHAPEYKSEQFFIFSHIIHHLDLARYLLGEISILHTERIYLSDRKVGFNITFQSEHGTIGNLQTASIQDGNFPLERVEIIGNGRNLIVDNIKKLEYNRPGMKKDDFTNVQVMDNADTLMWNLCHSHSSSYSYYGYENELHHFVQSLRNNGAPKLNLEDTVLTMQLLEDLKASI